jgi:hypothetical protein
MPNEMQRMMQSIMPIVAAIQKENEDDVKLATPIFDTGSPPLLLSTLHQHRHLRLRHALFLAFSQVRRTSEAVPMIFNWKVRDFPCSEAAAAIVG